MYPERTVGAICIYFQSVYFLYLFPGYKGKEPLQYELKFTCRRCLLVDDNMDGAYNMN